MRIQQILDKKDSAICAVSRGTVIDDIVKSMVEQNIGTVLVTGEDDCLAGILSERDVIRQLARRGADVLDLHAEEIMAKQVVTCTAGSDVVDVLEQMSARSIRHLPVVDRGVPVGMVSIRDLLDAQRALLVEDIERRRQAALALGPAGLAQTRFLGGEGIRWTGPHRPLAS